MCIKTASSSFLLFSFSSFSHFLIADRWLKFLDNWTIQIKCHVNCHVLSDPNATRVIRVPSWLTRHSDYNTSKLYRRSVMVAFLSDPVIWNYNFTSSNNRVRNTTDASKHDWLKFLFAMQTTVAFRLSHIINNSAIVTLLPHVTRNQKLISHHETIHFTSYYAFPRKQHCACCQCCSRSWRRTKT